MKGNTWQPPLLGLGMDVKYCLINGLAHNIQDATKVLLRSSCDDE